MSNVKVIQKAYGIAFVFDYTIIMATGLGHDEESAIDSAWEIVCTDLGVPPNLVTRAQDITIEGEESW